MGATNQKKHKPKKGKRLRPGSWIDWSEIPLGTKPDAEIAREYGLKAQTVAGARRRRGIPSVHGDTSKFAQRKIDWDNQPLGEMPDGILAERLGLSSLATVSSARQRRGIPRFEGLEVSELRRFYFDLMDVMTEFDEESQSTIQKLIKKHKLIRKKSR